LRQLHEGVAVVGSIQPRALRERRFDRRRWASGGFFVPARFTLADLSIVGSPTDEGPQGGLFCADPG
jgi:hypothetical protein